MLEKLDRFGLPVKYAVIGFLGALLWLLINVAMGKPLDGNAIATFIGFTLGGYIGGAIRKRRGKTG